MKKKLKLKKKYRKVIDSIIQAVIFGALTTVFIIGLITIYNWRVQQTQGQRPAAIEIFEK